MNPISPTIKDRIRDRMVKRSEGYIAAAEACGINPSRALDELHNDKEFASKIDRAREVIAERLHDEYIQLSDEPATTRDAVANKALRMKARWQVITSILKRFHRSFGGHPPHVANTLAITNQHITLDMEQQAMLRARRQELEEQMNRVYKDDPVVEAEIISNDNNQQHESKRPT
jgi:hypothetical protein